MTWIKMRCELGHDPDVIQIAAALDLDEFGVVGRLHALWSWLDQHSEDGTNVRIVSAYLDRLTACPGFADALRTVGWLSGRDGSLTFPGYESHNGSTAKARASESKRKAVQRARRDKCPGKGGTNVPDQAGPEKRREEKRDVPPNPQGGNERKPRKRFQRPTPDQVDEYGSTLSPPFRRGREFCDFYESKGWKVGSSPMKDWKAAVRTWQAKDKTEAKPQTVRTRL